MGKKMETAKKVGETVVKVASVIVALGSTLASLKIKIIIHTYNSDYHWKLNYQKICLLDY